MPIIIRSAILASLFAVVLTSNVFAKDAGRPNFVWIVSEDNSMHFQKLFFADGVATPNIEKLAEQGIVFERAFSNAPVCSVARTTLGTGVLAPRLGTQLHRRLRPATMPADWKYFTGYLRDAGYYATNRAKTDYNTNYLKDTWDMSSRKATWENCPDGKPFFHMESHAVSHESSLHFKQGQIKPEALRVKTSFAKIFPYHPDTPLFRYTHARYLDRQLAVDDIVGKVVAKLEKAGKLEDTFVFYFGDHGGVLPRSKGYVYESGLHVPLVVRVPKNFEHLVDREAGSRAKGFVSFIDFGPTVLNLAGAKVPEHMDGRPFLGKGATRTEVDSRDETFGYADRFDEKYDLVRSLRKGKYKYIRNYQAYYPDALQNNYRYIQLAFEEWRQLYHAGKLNEVQSAFFEARAPEMLFDLEVDPHETKNLAGDAQHAHVLLEMRARLAGRVKSLPDLGFYPEHFVVDKVLSAPVEFGQAHKRQIAQLVDTADLVLLPFDEAKPKLLAAMESKNPVIRNWALTACTIFGKEAASLVPAAKKHLVDSDLLVRVRAAEFLGTISAADPRPTIMQVLKESKSPVLTSLALNATVYLQDGKPGYEFSIKPEDVAAKDMMVSWRLKYLVK